MRSDPNKPPEVVNISDDENDDVGDVMRSAIEEIRLDESDPQISQSGGDEPVFSQEEIDGLAATWGDIDDDKNHTNAAEAKPTEASSSQLLDLSIF